MFASKLMLLKQTFVQLMRNVSGLWLVPIGAARAVVSGALKVGSVSSQSVSSCMSN